MTNWDGIVAGLTSPDTWSRLFLSARDFDWMSSTRDFIQIFILFLVIYSVLKAARGSRFGQVLTAAGMLVAVLAAITFIFNLDVLQKILFGLLIYLAVSSVVIFQPEIRRILETIGALLKDEGHVNRSKMEDGITPDAFVDCLYQLANRKLGALFAFERGISLLGYEMSGVTLDARISSELLISLLTPPLPLHDGGIVIRNSRIMAAHCLFPVSTSLIGLSGSGMRHRAAVGISEETDALVVVVSEERGLISIAHNGKLIRYPDLSAGTRADLLRRIRRVIQPQRTTVESLVDWVMERGGVPARITAWLQRPFGVVSKEIGK